IKASHQALIPLVENSKTGSSKTGSDAGAQAKGQAGSNPDETSEGQSGSNPNETSEGQAGPDPGDAEARQLDEGFTATVYPNVQENLKLVVDEPVLLEEPASSSRTLSSLQHLSRDFSFEEHQQLKATTTNTTTTTTATLPPPQAPQQSTTEAMMQCNLLAVASLFFWQWHSSAGSGKFLLAVKTF
nr:hypothetical protein [Tanacetum cinerariifolium]